MNQTLIALLIAVAPAVLVAQLPEYVPTQNLVGWYPMNGNAQDESSFSNNGSIHGALPADDRFGTLNSAYEFNGSSDYIGLGTLQNTGFATGDFTVSAWIWIDTPKRHWVLSNYEAGPALSPTLLAIGAENFDGNAVLHLDLRKPNTATLDVLGTTTIGLNEWHHVVVVKSGTTITAYLDNLLEISENFQTTGDLNNGYIYQIGTEDGAQFWDGKLDDIGLWSRALDSLEIHALFSPILGCTDTSACNYDSEANADDGSCSYPTSLDLGEDIETCEDSVTLDAGEGFGSYLWITGETSQTITISESGLYEATVSSHPANEGSLSFDGDGDWVSIAPIQSDVLEVGGAASVEITYAGYGALFSATRSYAPHYPVIFRTEVYDLGNGAATYIIYHRSSSLSVNESFMSDSFSYNGEAWNTVTVAIDNEIGRYTLYHNGQTFLDFDFEPASFSSPDLVWGIGNLVYNGGGTNYFSGFIDHVTVYDEYLTEADANDLFGCTLSLNPAHEWDFEEGQGEVAIDATGNENHGQLIGATWSDHTSSNSNCQSCESSDEILVDFDDCDGYCGEGTVWDPINQECIVAIPTDTDFDGCVTAGDVLNLLATFGTCPPIPFSGPCQGQDHVTYDGYDYDIVAIGEQCWFAENARFLPEVSPAGIGSEQDGLPHAYVYGWNNESVVGALESSSYTDYGALYNFEAVQSWALCPSGWHVPTHIEWIEIIEYLGGATVAGVQMKADYGWSQDGNGSNSSGFTALPAGTRYGTSAYFNNVGINGFWWSSTSSSPYPWSYYTACCDDEVQITNFDYNQHWGLSVRCTKDQ